MNNKQPNNEVQQVPSTTPKPFRNTNANEYMTNGQAYQIFPEGIIVSKTKLVRNIKRENREKALYSIGLNTLALNPHLNEDDIFNSLCSINNNPKQINIPLKYNELRKIVAGIFKKRDEEGELQPDLNHTRKIIFDTLNYPKTKQEIRKIVGKVTGEMKTAKTKQAIYEAIESWDRPEKITIPKLSSFMGKGYCERTIKKYWSEFKDWVKTINASTKPHKTSHNKALIETQKQVQKIEPVQSGEQVELYDTLASFAKVAKHFKPLIDGESIKRYYDTMAEIEVERNEANIKRILRV